MNARLTVENSVSTLLVYGCDRGVVVEMHRRTAGKDGWFRHELAGMTCFKREELQRLIAFLENELQEME
jgi:hypothetical protein